MPSKEKREPQRPQVKRQDKRECQESGSDQERVNKRQKKTGLMEEDESGVEVYYQEGEEEVEEMKCMAFHLKATEIEKAWGMTERALKTISFREEQEKLKVLVALVNVKNMYDSQEFLTKVFKWAVQYNEPLKVFLHLADIYSKSEKFQEAGELYNRMLKRFWQEKAVWIKYGAFLLHQEEPGWGQSLSAAMGPQVFTYQGARGCDCQVCPAGVPARGAERAKAMFENTLSTYPKCIDVWSVYIDITIKHGSQKEVRDIFERVIHLSLAPKRMKFFSSAIWTMKSNMALRRMSRKSRRRPWNMWRARVLCWIISGCLTPLDPQQWASPAPP
ncbi:Protein RRP5-like protein [Sciurus carolinensis]|uniref:Protein RRP5-like protein n=1 Tax=Sciurus carolinensis TaxID=30640 RepID=A0AA41T3Q3_SCICA|nr:Protein RRP5-like protein [Sciurus carolinensis]